MPEGKRLGRVTYSPAQWAVIKEMIKRAKPVSLTPRERCGLCGEWATGYAMSSDDNGRVRLCHDDERSCYHRWTVYEDRP